MENTDPPPPYPGPSSYAGRPSRRTRILRLGPDAPLQKDFGETYCHKHMLLATTAPGLPTTIHHWKCDETGELVLSSTPIRAVPDSLNHIEDLQELGFCELPPEPATRGNEEDMDWVARLVKTLVTEGTMRERGTVQRPRFTTASPESEGVIAWIQKHLSAKPQLPLSRPATVHTGTTTTTPGTQVQVFAIPVFGRSPEVLASGKGPHLVWGYYKPSLREEHARVARENTADAVMERWESEAGGWQLSLDPYLAHWELGPEWGYRKHKIRPLVAGASDEVYEGMVSGESRPFGIL